jgi:hemolysin type calcium-binding protein
MPTHRSVPRSRTAALLGGLAALIVPLALAGSASANVSSTFDAATGTLTVTSDAADGIAVTCAATQVKVNGNDPLASPLACSAVVKLVVNGGPGDNTIDLSGVTATDFTALTSSEAHGNGGNDTITGTDRADTLTGDGGTDRLVGFRGGDQMIGGDGDDTMVWNNGDGSDVMDGQDGSDTAEVNGAGAAGDVFTINPNGQRVRFDRTNLVPFNIDIGTSEKLLVNAGGGDDRIAGAKGLAGLIVSTFNGDDGKDIITGTDGEDLLSGGKGFDIIDAKDKAADQVECDGGIDFARVDRRDLVRGCELVLGGRLRVAVSAKVAKVSGGVAALKLKCVATQGCKGTVKLRRAGRTLASKRFEMTRASTKTVRLKINRTGRRLVAGASRRGIRVDVRVDARDAKGNGWRSTSQLRLTR